MDLPIGCYGNESILLAPSEMVSVFYFTLFIIGHEEGSVQSSATDDTWTVGPSLLPPFHLLKERELPPWNIDQVTQTPVYNVYVKSAVFALNIRFNITADTDSMLFQIAPPALHEYIHRCSAALIDCFSYWLNWGPFRVVSSGCRTLLVHHFPLNGVRQPRRKDRLLSPKGLAVAEPYEFRGWGERGSATLTFRLPGKWILEFNWYWIDWK